MEKYEIVVVGGGPAGITLAKRLGKRFKMAVIRPEDHSMIYCAMPYAIEGLIEMESTFKKDDLVTDAGAELIVNSVVGIDFDHKTLELADGETIEYEKIVLATGAEPFIPQLPGISLDGVSGFKTERDMRSLKSMISKGLEHAVVVGAGAIGIELAQALRDAGLDVDLVDMGYSVLPNLIDAEISGEIQEEIVGKGIKLHLETKVIALEGNEYVERVLLDNGQTIGLGSGSDEAKSKDHKMRGAVIFAAGMKPSLELVKNSSIEQGAQGIIVNGKMETNIPDVYAVGDCTQFKSGITCGTTPGKLATNAVPMAKVLADNLLGGGREYAGFYNGAATKVGRYYVGGTGLTELSAISAGYEVESGFSEITTRFPIMPNVKQMKIKLIVDKRTGKLIGGQTVSGEPVTTMIDLITFAIQKDSHIEDFIDLSYSSQPYQSYFPAANALVLASEQIAKRLNPPVQDSYSAVVMQS